MLARLSDSALQRSLDVQLAGETMQLLAPGALYRPSCATLMIADLHLGKTESFRASGIPVPTATTISDLQRLSMLLQSREVARLVVLGDFLHSRAGRTAALISDFDQWRDTWPDLQIILVRGNHDLQAGDPPSPWRVEAVDEPFDDGGLIARHSFEDEACDRPTVAGHVHPAVVVRGPDGFRQRLSCFWIAPQRGQMLLPAFGSFTGRHRIRPLPDERVIAVGDEHVVDVTPLVV